MARFQGRGWGYIALVLIETQNTPAQKYYFVPNALDNIKFVLKEGVVKHYLSRQRQAKKVEGESVLVKVFNTRSQIVPKKEK